MPAALVPRDPQIAPAPRGTMTCAPAPGLSPVALLAVARQRVTAVHASKSEYGPIPRGPPACISTTIARALLLLQPHAKGRWAKWLPHLHNVGIRNVNALRVYPGSSAAASLLPPPELVLLLNCIAQACPVKGNKDLVYLDPNLAPA